MNRLLGLAVCFLFLCLFSGNLYAWNKSGHMIVAGVAYLDLKRNDADTLDKVNDLLKSHVAYDDWVDEYAGYSQDIKNKISLEAYVFMRAAAWPDDMRDDIVVNGKPKPNPEHKPLWHYIDYPITLPDEVDLDHPIPATTNALIAFRGQLQILTGNGTSNSIKERKAKSLGWIFHLVGDIHQPMHGAALVNSDFPDGDQGGNLVCVRYLDEETDQSKTVSLHSFWDDIVRKNGRSARVNGQFAWDDANFYLGSIRDVATGDLTGNEGMEAWVKESAKIALDSVYKFDGQQINFKKKANKNCPVIADADSVSSRYNNAATTIARRRVVTAGLRLAKELGAAL